MGKNVLVGGEAWIKNKEISYDPRSKLEYFELISKLISKPHMSMKNTKEPKNTLTIFFLKG